MVVSNRFVSIRHLLFFLTPTYPKSHFVFLKIAVQACFGGSGNGVIPFSMLGHREPQQDSVTIPFVTTKSGYSVHTFGHAEGFALVTKFRG